MDGSWIRPELGGLSAGEVRAVAVRVGRVERSVGDLFEVAVEGSCERVVVRGAPPLDRIGEGMVRGELVIEGDAGDDLGASMRGGLIRVTGRAGDRVGGPGPSAARGMTGGEIVVGGDAGAKAGLRMRRGLIAIGGRAGPLAGYRMLAGTVAVGVGPPDRPGLEMRRGTILCLSARGWEGVSAAHAGGVASAGGGAAGAGASSPSEAVPGWFGYEGTFDRSTVPAIGLVLGRLAELGVAGASERSAGWWAVYSGDRFELGTGELWQAVTGV